MKYKNDLLIQTKDITAYTEDFNQIYKFLNRTIDYFYIRINCMRKRSCLLVLFLFFFICSSAQRKKKLRITGQVTYTQLYKGGARPTEEILQQCCQPQPWRGKKIYIKKNYYSKELSVIHTDSTGNFDVCLREGTYNIYISNEKNKSLSKEIEQGKGDEQKKWLTEPYATIIVSRDGERNFRIELKERRNTEVPLP